jgi:hypothetical protein
MAETKETKAKRGLGFKDDGEAYPGVDPKTGERVTVTLAALKSEFGSAKGAKMYERIFETVFTNPRPMTAGAEHNPDIQIVGASDDVRAEVQRILTEKE